MGRGRDSAPLRVGPCVSSRAGARAGHGWLCGPTGPSSRQPLVVSVAGHDPRVEATVCGRWSRGPSAGGHSDDTKASVVPVRDGERGPGSRAQNLGSVSYVATKEARRPDSGQPECHLRMGPEPSRHALLGTCAKSREGSTAQGPGSAGQLRGRTSNASVVNPAFLAGVPAPVVGCRLIQLQGSPGPLGQWLSERCYYMGNKSI